MGIRGLSTFFSNNPKLSKSYKLHDTSVIIDGNNLIHVLYFSRKIDCVYGGDYYKYAAAIKKYFSSYLECNIKPVIIFDGGYDPSDRKFETCLLRSKTRLTVAQRTAKYGKHSGSVLPICAPEIFRNVLSEMGIPFAQCEFEADEQLVALANYYECPVLSNDSDFYIFDVHKGFIRLDSVGTSVLETDIDGTKCKYLDCAIYHIDNFMAYFPGLDRNILPLFGTLVGNDYVNTEEFESVLESINIAKRRKYRGLLVHHGQNEIVRLLTWLEHSDINKAMKHVLGHLKKEKREHVERVINQSMNGYKIQNCNLMFIIDNKLDELKNILVQNPRLKSLCGQSLPIPIMIAFHLGNLPSFFLNIVNHHREFLKAQVENTSLPSSYVCSRYIRQVIYGILLQHSTIDEKTHKEVCLQNICEYDRRHGNLTQESVAPIFLLKNGNAIPKLDDLFCLEKKHLQKFLLDVLQVDMDFISCIPNSLQLLFGCIIYWLKNSACAPRDDFIYALLLNIVYFHVILNKSTQNNHTSSKSVCSEQLPFLSIIDSISIEEAKLAAQNMKKYLQNPSLNRSYPLELHIVHSFSQLQTCILYTSYLNCLLNCPFEHPKLNEAFAGCMLYNLTKDLSTRPLPHLFISDLLGRQSNLNTLFNNLKDKLLENIETDCIELTNRSLVRKGRKGSKKSMNQKKRRKIEKDAESLCNQLDNVKSTEEAVSIYNLGEIFI
ncbi:protein asteroid homolog 1 [Trichonephila inaurata madagascariensis]|uniref:Protein asteroid homolog 1 n=1 Tax=Trichonephila inaurata madagascariensis TaxID=2747483 RepID=A0A8X7C8X0_9ARAC|nr:protein asteroid homolog 1 [Trichonephila inaurata madagascariensis]